MFEKITIPIVFDDGVITFSIKLPTAKINSNSRLVGNELFISIAITNPELSIGYKATIEVMVQEEPLIFVASVTVKIVEVSITLRLEMQGMWRRAFGIKKLSIGNIIGELGITVTPPWINTIMLGGQVEIGDPGDPEPIVGKFYFKVNIKDPTESWFYGSITKLTLQDVFSINF